ncbi:haloacid dehalogenase type II [Nocardiopsis gilva YIM 90087]|uniref:Haloacid dehalogenase type II n=1 Tax=Nocardiopsis gilva YIM 90087 TaxID=1235441 RepID=A0A223SCI1_9ACTN|nr:haloacid dehalogenase type II [Nocardiopsis gilva]ASU85857.1 haloacid dehalogenase type II [Nocardiopsis gilva YIM 90087]
MTTARRPHVVAFDVMETLFPLTPLEWRFREAGVPRVLMHRWFAHVLRDAFALTAAGDYRPFGDLARGALQDITGHQVSAAAVESIVQALASLDVRPDADAAVRRIRDAEVRVVALTNSSEENARSLLDRAGLAVHMEHVLSAGKLRRFKPAPEPYHYAAEVCEVEPDRMAMVTCHAWDVHGAHRAGLVTGWSDHLEGRFPSVFAAPDVTGRGLVPVATDLLELPD